MSPPPRLRLVFCGTPQFAAPSLTHLLRHPEFEILAVYTQPDRPKGRSQEIIFSPVKKIALAANLPVHQPEKIRAPEVEEHLRAFAPDVIVIIAYGQIIPARLLDIPKLGWLNLHASLLPKYRGAAPIHWAIAHGETVTGNTTMRIDAGMDTGKILLQQQLLIGEHETSPHLSTRLAEAGAPLMVETLRGAASHSIMARAQDNSHATLAPILKREDGLIDWSRPADEIYNRQRAFTPWPGSYSAFRGQTCHLLLLPASNPFELSATPVPPGTLLPQAESVHVTCGQGSVLRVTGIKLEGRKLISAADFLRGARLEAGERFESI
jgi:methionyl-tRNA formyltransferase